MIALETDKLHSQLEALQSEMILLCEHVLSRATIRLEQQARILEPDNINKSCVNLAHYLALRELDLRPLQEKLAEAGLSSLGRAESHVFATLRAVVTLLGQAVGKPDDVQCGLPHPAFREGFEILGCNTTHFLGQASNQHETRIMVTLSSEAASDQQLVHNLIREGMDCARINCAHDSPDIWLRMIENVKQAADIHRRECRILMDMAGHKVRTGPVVMEDSALHIKVRKNAYGLMLEPAHVLLLSESLANEQQDIRSDLCSIVLPDVILKKLQAGDRLLFRDARAKKRYLYVDSIDAVGYVLANCRQSIYLQPGATITVQRRRKLKFHDIDSFRHRHECQREVRILLRPGDELILHASAEPGEAAKYDQQGNLIAPAHISCTLPQLIAALTPDDPVWIDDGKISCSVTHVSENAATLRVLQAGPKGAVLKPDKGLNVPQTDMKLPALSDKDLQDLDFICQHADMIGFSFVESAEDMHSLFKALELRNRADLPVVAKIETSRAVRNLPEILFSGIAGHSLAIMIARGDLAVELGSVRMAEIQEEILWLSEAAHVPVIWATQVLESIAKHGVRSRPEFTDAAMGIRAECVMLNKGPYILDAVRSLDAVLKRMQAHQRKKISRLRALHW